MLRVYIAGPYTHGDVAENVREAIVKAHDLLDLGYAPFCPHLSHFLHLHRPRRYMEWMILDLQWLRVSDVILRLPGDSPGADTEEELARQEGIPVVYTVAELVERFPAAQRLAEARA